MFMSLRELTTKYSITFKRSLGQNLLLDENINRIMVDAAAVGPQDDIVEVGAGLGALTARLHPKARRVLAVEIDRSFMPCLEDRFRDVPNVCLFRGDILNHGLDKLCEEFLPGATSLKMVSNLPYYITTPILFHFWEAPVFFSRAVVMVQEEVGQRMTSEVGAKDYGVLSLASRLRSEVDVVHRVPNTCFKPKPKVHSCIVRLRNHETPLYPDIDLDFITMLIRAAFSQRRKTINNSLAKSGRVGFDTSTILKAMEAAHIDPGRRPQTLSLDEFANLARHLSAGAGAGA